MAASSAAPAARTMATATVYSRAIAWRSAGPATGRSDCHQGGIGGQAARSPGGGWTDLLLSPSAPTATLEQCFSSTLRMSWALVQPAGGGTELERHEHSWIR